MPKSFQSMTSPERSNLNWAQKIYYQAKYGIGEIDAPDLSLPEHRSEKSVPGSDDRLQKLLLQDRVSVDSRRSDSTLIHTGPDGSVIITNEMGWGLPYQELSGLYFELDDRYMCHWEISQATWTPEAPYWAICPDR